MRESVLNSGRTIEIGQPTPGGEPEDRPQWVARLKSREGDHFAIAVGLASEVEGFVPTVPDWALDGHTVAGKRMGRGLAFFREHSAKLVPPVKPDAYEDEAYRLLELKQRKVKRDLFDEA